MAFARDVYDAGAAQTDYTITYPYIAEGHVTVYEDGTLMVQGAGAGKYTIVAETTVRFGTAHAGGEKIVIVRSTSQSARLVDYATASTLTEEDLDNDSLQAFYMVQEAIDAADTALGLSSGEIWDALNTVIDNVGTPTADDHAATKVYVDDAITNAALGTLTAINAENIQLTDLDAVILPDDGKITTAAGVLDIEFDETAGRFNFYSGGVLVFAIDDQAMPAAIYRSDDGPVLGLTHTGASAVTNDAALDFSLNDAGETPVDYGRISITSADVTDGAHEGIMELLVAQGGTLAAYIELDGVLEQVEIKKALIVEAPASNAPTTANTGAINSATGNNWTVTPAGNITFAFSNKVAGLSGFIFLDNAGGHTISWPAEALFPAATEPTLAAGEHLIGFYMPNTSEVVITSATALA